MLLKPLFKINSPSLYHVILVISVILMYSCCIETDIYVPAFPEMLKVATDENKIQLVLSINFLGLCLASTIVGPLADAYGRRVVILMGLGVFMISSIFLLIVDSYFAFLFWRFVQGVATAVPMVCGGAIFLDRYTNEHASKLIGIINSFITAMMAAAPIIGAGLTEYYGWKSNFMLVALLAVINFLAFWFFVEESLSIEKRKKFQFKTIVKDFQKIITNPAFNCYILLACLPFITIVVYITSLSVIFVNHLGMDLTNYSYYQASTMTIFVIFSLYSVKLINKKGVTFTYNLGTIISGFGALMLMLIAIIAHTNAALISLAMAFIAAGGAFMAGTFGMKALSIFPDMNATALSVATMMRLFLIAVMVFISQIYFDGTIIPIAIIIFTYCLVTMIFYLWILLSKR